MAKHTTTTTISTSDSSGQHTTIDLNGNYKTRGSRNYSYNKSITSTVSSSYTTSAIVRALGAILLLLLLLNLFMSLQGDSDNIFTFTRLLEIASSYSPGIVTDILLKFRFPEQLVPNIPILREMAIFFNTVVIAPLNVLMFLVGGIAYIVDFVGHFLSFIFV